MAATLRSMPKRVAVFICSTRPQRINPLVASFVLSTLRSHPSSSKVEFSTIDIASPLSPSLNRQLLSLATEDQEPAIPAQLPKDDPSPHYALEATRVWSKLISGFDGFIFVTPQYNWSVPAPVKHMIDLLYHEWTAKPAWAISYGGRGGNLCRGALEQVLQGLHMRGVMDGQGKGVELKVPVKLGIGSIAKGALGAEIVAGWEADGMIDRLKEGMEKMVETLYTVPESHS